MALAAPLSVTVVAVPLAAGLIVPEILYVVDDTVFVAEKLTPLTLAAFTVADWLAGLKLYPLLVGVTA